MSQRLFSFHLSQHFPIRINDANRGNSNSVIHPWHVTLRYRTRAKSFNGYLLQQVQKTEQQQAVTPAEMNRVPREK